MPEQLPLVAGFCAEVCWLWMLNAHEGQMGSRNLSAAEMAGDYSGKLTPNAAT